MDNSLVGCELMPGGIEARPPAAHVMVVMGDPWQADEMRLTVRARKLARLGGGTLRIIESVQRIPGRRQSPGGRQQADSIAARQRAQPRRWAHGLHQVE